MGAGIYTCPTCKKTYTGIVCSPCFAKASSGDRHGFFRGLIKNDPHEIKREFKDYYHNFNQDLRIYSAPKGMGKTVGIQPDPLEEKPQLTLYEVTVHIQRPSAYKGASTHREVVVVILAVDSTAAMSYAETSQGVTRIEDMAKSTCEEIKGPFKNGFVVSARHG